jgi:hypothetical protein
MEAEDGARCATTKFMEKKLKQKLLLSILLMRMRKMRKQLRAVLHT